MKLRLHQRYFLIMLGLVIASIAAVSAALLVHYERSIAEMKRATARAYSNSLLQQFENRARGLGLVSAEALVNSLALLNVEGVSDVVRAVEAEPDVVAVVVYGNAGLSAFGGTGILPWHAGRSGQLRPHEAGFTVPDKLSVDQDRINLIVSAPVRLGAQVLGVVRIELSKATLNRDLAGLAAELAEMNRAAKRSRTLWLVGIAGLLTGLSSLWTIVLARGLSRPIKLLSSLTARIGQGDYRIAIPVRRSDEIGELARSLEAMAQHLERTTISRDNFDRILNSMRDGLLLTTPAGVITDANQAAVRLFGRTTTDLIGRPVAEVVPGGDAIVSLQHHELLKRGFLDSFETTIVTKDRGSVPVLLSASAMRGRDGAVQAIVCVFHDIAERKRVEVQIQHMAHHDALTGLPNRVLLQDRLRQAIAQANRSDHTVALLLLDLDGFKEVNDTLGHTAGDKVLTMVAKRIREALRETDTVARLGGDEFAIVQTGARQPDDAEALCRRLVEVISRPLHLAQQDVYVGASIGIALYPTDGQELERLLQHADLALYEAKAEGRSTWRFFEPWMNVRLQERKTLEGDLRRALARRKLALHYQPQVDLASRDLIGVEALLRWHHPEHGWVPPDVFIPLAEQTGLIMPLGEWVLRAACAQAAVWRAHGNTRLRVAINLSPSQFRHRDLAGLVKQALAEADLPAHLLELEITEGTLMHDSATNLATLHRLRELGVSIAMDDFGTGYSSLSYLRRFPFNAIKIDRCFVQDLGHNLDAAAILRAAITLGRSLGIECIAEGVETEAQLALLKEEGCRMAQGYYFSAPRPASEISCMIKQMWAA